MPYAVRRLSTNWRVGALPKNPKGLDHKIWRLSVERVTNLPNNTKIQIMSAWRYSAMNYSLGKPWLTRLQGSIRVPFHTTIQKLIATPVSHKIQWLHEHLDARWCVGDAVTDYIVWTSSRDASRPRSIGNSSLILLKQRKWNVVYAKKVSHFTCGLHMRLS